MSEFEGMVEAFSQKPKGWAIKVGERWYSGNRDPKPQKGSIIKGTYETKDWNGRIFFNIKSYEIVAFPEKESTIQTAPPVPLKDISQIHRQSALKCSSLLVSAYIHTGKLNVNEAEIMAIQLADKFVEYIEKGYEGDFHA